MTHRRVLLIGGTGVFGQRLARHLAGFAGLDLVLTSRDAGKAQAVAADMTPAHGTRVSGIGLDHRRGLPGRLAELAPWLVIDASGPFQGAGYDVPRAALEAGAHVVDLADARDYMSGYAAALDALARTHGLAALAGASSTPALSAAAVAAITQGWRRIDTIDIAITPGGRSEVGRAVIEAILSYAGRPIPVWREGELQEIDGWVAGRRVAMPGLGQRRIAAVETVDAQDLGLRLDVRSRVSFGAGLESGIEQAGIMLLARLRRAGLIGKLDELIPLLLAARRITRLPTSDRGGMLVAATGIGPDGALRSARWSLLAERGDGPQVPTLPAAAAVRALLDGTLESGARSAAGVLPLTAIEAEMTPYAISTERDYTLHPPGLIETALGADAFAALPAPLRAFHAGDGAPVWRGRARIVTGNGVVVRLLRKLIGLPEAGEDVPITVSVERIVAADGPVEIWTRNFGGVRFSSRLSLGTDGGLREAFGPAAFQLELAQADDDLHLPVVSARMLGVPLPSLLLPRSEAREFVDPEGRFYFDVRLTLPFFGLLTHYRGWLVPPRI